MKVTLFFLLFTSILKTSAQVKFTKKLDPLIREEYKKIRNLGSDTIIIYEQYCVGCEMIYFHKQGSEDAIRECVYEGFIRGKIYWKLRNRYYSKEIACINDANIKIAEVKGEIFEYFFSNLNKFKSIERHKFNGRFFPPIPDHTSYEKLSIYTPKISHQILLAEQQKDDTNWKTYEWIPPTIEIMEIVEKIFPHVN
ncbi:hypothetical protein [Pedobacter gandavensis]|uniref:Uncharacterized protein n=1 Tax=Pedobacter gandavensis TaxID=2679963 RepID=A0ABR6F1L8_9SPHI|nr:hypothetical protein [Pedobacter gandavensis]MBB2151430.1 hypothetical protein [Pedobacter gandavensis]